jgi:hypothetical protein
VTGYFFAAVLCVILIISLVQLLRHRRIQEKYVAIWIVVALGVAIIGAVPHLATKLAELLGVQLPVNLLFATSIFVLLIVCIQLSVDLSKQNERTRVLAEEIAVLKADVQRLSEQAVDRAPSVESTERKS